MNDSLAAAELRRLHEVNAELVEALKWIASHDLKNADDRVGILVANSFIYRAAEVVAKAQGDNNAAD